MASATRSAPSTLVRTVTGAVFTLLACNSVLGIQDAHVDPTLSIDGENKGGGGGSAGQAQGGGITNTGGSSGDSSKAGGGSGPVVASGGSPDATGGKAARGGSETLAGGGASAGEPNSGGSAQGGEGGEAGGDGMPPAVSLCEQYCDTITQYCSGSSLQYTDRDQCLAVCKLFPQGAVGDPDSNTIACRVKYAGKARYAGGTELNAYCRQAGPGGDGRCGSNCDGFCTISMATCTAEDTPPYFFANDGACHTACQSLPDIPYVYGDVSVADGNSVECRLFHVISAAMMDPEEHCEHVLGITLCEK